MTRFRARSSPAARVSRARPVRPPSGAGRGLARRQRHPLSWLARGGGWPPGGPSSRERLRPCGRGRRGRPRRHHDLPAALVVAEPDRVGRRARRGGADLVVGATGMHVVMLAASPAGEPVILEVCRRPARRHDVRLVTPVLAGAAARARLADAARAYAATRSVDVTARRTTD